MTDAARARWNAEYLGGRWDFLERERARLALVAGLVRGEVGQGLVDLGCGPGLLLDWLPESRRADYVGVDIADAALDRLRERHPRARTKRSALRDFRPDASPIATLIASEVLTYDDDSVAELTRIAACCEGLVQIIVSVVAAHPDKPNWARGSQRVWSALDAGDWRRVRSARLRDEASGVGWDLVDFAPSDAGRRE